MESIIFLCIYDVYMDSKKIKCNINIFLCYVVSDLKLFDLYSLTLHFMLCVLCYQGQNYDNTIKMF